MTLVNNITRRTFIKNCSIASIIGINTLAAMPSVKEPDGKDKIFLFQGDSITDGNRTHNNDWNI